MKTSTPARPSRAVWVQDKDAYLVALLQAQVLDGKRVDTGFKKDAWNTVTELFNIKYPVNYDRDQLKTRYKQVLIKLP